MFQKHILAWPVPVFQPVFTGYLIEGRDLPLLQHGGAAVLLEPADEQAADAWLNGDHSGVVEHVSRAGVRQRLMQLELAAHRLQITDGVVLGPAGFVIRNAATTLAQAANANEHGWRAFDCTKLQFNLMRPIHDRMPVIVRPENYAAWLDPGVTDAHLVRELAGEYPPAGIEVYPVGRAVGNPRAQGPGLVGRLV